jgi:alkylated DNA repair dioxygenase AlkB
MTNELVPGLEIHQLITNEFAQNKLYELVDNFDEDTPLKRKTRQYGYEYDYKARETLKKSIYTTPTQLLCISDILYKHKLIGQKPNQIIINKYEPGEGIAAHRDHTGYFTGDIATLSLGSEYVMTFRPHPENKLVDPNTVYDILLPVGSLAVMKDDASTKWTHEIRKVKYDNINGKKIKRGTRISITFRTVRDELQEN